MTDALLYASGSIAYLAELMHLLGKSHGAVKNDIQNKINYLLRSGKRRRDTRKHTTRSRGIMIIALPF